MKYLIRFFLWLGRARWVVDTDGDMGLRVFGVNIISYKWPDTFVYPDDVRLIPKRGMSLSGMPGFQKFWDNDSEKP